MSHRRDKCRHDDGWENAPVQASNFALHLGRHAARTRSPQSGHVGTDVTNTCNKSRVFLGRFPPGEQVLFTWTCGGLPSDLSLRGPDVSLDMCLLAVSDETAGSDRSEPMTLVLSDPHGWRGAMAPANTDAYVTPPSGGPCCRLLTAATSPMTDEIAGRGADPAPGAGRLLVDSIKSS